MKSSTLTYYSYSFWCPPLYVFALMNQAPGLLKLEAHENYQKRSWRNRTIVMGPNGKQTLSIPLEKGKNNKMPIQSVRISNTEDWKTQHLRTLQTNYQSAPYFEHYFPKIEMLYGRKYNFLWDWNWSWIRYWLEIFDFSIELGKTDRFGGVSPSFHILDSKNKNYIYKFFNSEFWYPQVYEDKFRFTPSVSIMDTLFCAGPETRSYLKSFFTSTFDLNTIQKK